MKIGIISFAHRSAWEYARSLKEMEVELLGITDEKKERGKEASTAFSVQYYPSKEELLSQGIDVVIICSENANHKEDVMLSAKAKKHIICEMPLATSVSDAEEMLRRCQNEGVFLIPALPLRYSPPLRRAKELIEEGQIGEILAMKGTHRSKVPKGWYVEKSLAGGGALLQNSLSMIDIMRWLCKQEIIEVFAEIKQSSHLNLGVEDIASVALRFNEGIFATLDPSWCYPSSFPFWGDFTIDIVGREGTLIVNAFAQTLSHMGGVDNSYSWKYWGSDIHSLMLRDYLSHIEEGKEPPVNPFDGLRALEVALKAYQSGERHEPMSI